MCLQRAAETGVEIVIPRHRSPRDDEGGPIIGSAGCGEPDGYVVVVASPYGTAGGSWRPGQ